MELVEVGHRVRVKSLGIKGTVEHIDQPYLFHDHMNPIQIKLDKPYYEPDIPNAYMYRTGLRDIVRLKKKQVEEPDYEREIRGFLKWLSRY